MGEFTEKCFARNLRINMIYLAGLDKVNVNNKRVIVRCDFDVPLDGDKKILDDTRLVSSVSTIEFLIENGATVILVGHLGRPKGNDPDLSLEPVARWFEEEFPGIEVKKTHLGEFEGWKLRENLYLLENLRFYEEEEKNDSSFSHKLAYLGDIYVNEAFGSSHRAHASIVGVAGLLPHFAGFHLRKEITILSNLIDNPKRPFTFIVGGAKIETKLPLISKMHKFADYVLVGGQIAEQAKVLIEEQHRKGPNEKAMLFVADSTIDKNNITQNSLENFIQIISRSSCIVWNGPMGFIENGFTNTTEDLANAIQKTNAYKVIGGGDTIGFLNQKNMLNKFDFVSVGGGAMLEFLAGESLPGIIALQDS